MGDSVEVPPKKRATSRGFSKKANSKPIEAESQSAVYTTRVMKSFDIIKTHGFDEMTKAAASHEDEDIEDDLPEVCKTKTMRDIDEMALLDQENVQSGAVTLDDSHISFSPPPPPTETCGVMGKTKRKRAKWGAKKRQQQLLSAASDLDRQMFEMQSHLTAVSSVTSPDQEVYVIDSSDELTVRLELMGKIQRFIIQHDEPFSTIVSQIGSQECVKDGCVMLVLKDKTLRPTDTPSSVNLQLADIIQCHIVKNDGDVLNDSCNQDTTTGTTIELVVQCQTSRRPENVRADPDQPLSYVMREYAKRVNKDPTLLQFYFDGDVVTGCQTPTDLGMDDGDILDVREQEVTLIT